MSREDVIREIQERYRQSGRSLNEFQRRHWAAIEAMKIGWGGISVVSKALRISPNTIRRGIQDIETGQAASYSESNARIRKSGGGRKSKKTPLNRSLRANSHDDSSGSVTPFRDSEAINARRDDASPASIELQSLKAPEAVPGPGREFSELGD